ncbi:MAG: PQQ-binding-like beta-propeller repeat protein, partial [Nitrospira sp.]|nr:PQQ-binding-like beta-propeller repeat protein [Nitrospira sp.]
MSPLMVYLRRGFMMFGLVIPISSVGQSGTPPLIYKKISDTCIVTTPALGDDGHFYTTAGSTCSGGFGVTAYDPVDGSRLWGPITAGCSNFGRGGVSVGANGLVYALGDWNDCRDGRLVALNTGNGAIAWNHGGCVQVFADDSPHPRQTPALNEALQSVYFGSPFLCSVDMNSGVNNWVVSGGGYIGEGGIAVDSQDNIYYGTNSGGESTNFLRSFSSAGAFRWEQAVGTRGSKIMGITSNDTILIHKTAGGVESLVALDNTGTTQEWEVSNVTRPVIDGSGNIYVSSATGADVSSLDPSGAERWRVTLPSETVARIDFIDNQGHVYVRGTTTLYALNGSDGSVAWSFIADADLS